MEADSNKSESQKKNEQSTRNMVSTKLVYQSEFPWMDCKEQNLPFAMIDSKALLK